MIFFRMWVLSLGIAGLCSCAQPSIKASSLKPAQGFTSSESASSTNNAFQENPIRWRLLSDEKGLKVYQDLEVIRGRIGLRGKIILNASIGKVATALTELDLRKIWMSNLVENRVLRGVSDFERIEYSKLKIHGPFNYLDFIYQMTFSVLREPQTLLIRMVSPNNDMSVPIPPDTVRGQVTGSYDFVRLIDANHSELVMEVGLDPKEALPYWQSQGHVLEWFHHCMTGIQQMVEDPKMKISKRVQAYMDKYQLSGSEGT